MAGYPLGSLMSDAPQLVDAVPLVASGLVPDAVVTMAPNLDFVQFLQSASAVAAATGQGECLPGVVMPGPPAPVAPLSGRTRTPGMVGKYTIQQRRQKIERYVERRPLRVYDKVIRYEVRKKVADRRQRVRGRFALEHPFDAAGASAEGTPGEEAADDDAADADADSDAAGGDVSEAPVAIAAIPLTIPPAPQRR